MSDAGILIPILGISCGLVAIIGGVFVRPWMRFKERQLELQSHEAAEKAARYAAQTERLEQRVRVLERILTDQGNQLAAQIEDLRGEPAHREG